MNRPIRYPALYQINIQVYSTKLSRNRGSPATLDDIPDSDLNALAARVEKEGDASHPLNGNRRTFGGLFFTDVTVNLDRGARESVTENGLTRDRFAGASKGHSMEELFKEITGYTALGLEAAAVLIIAIGGVQAFFGMLRSAVVAGRPLGLKKEIWLRFGMWLLLGLEFELGADVIRTAISPTWFEIEQLGAIALIRTFLNFFLERDLEKYAEPGSTDINTVSMNRRAA